jgi:uroporphyrinogen decarboxylase
MHRWQQIVDVGDEIKRRFDVDFRGVFLGEPERTADLELGEGRYKDMWGVVRRKPPSSLYYDLEESPLAGEIAIRDIVRYPWPDPDDPGMTRGLRDRIDGIRNDTDYAIVLNLPSAFVHASQYLRGFEDWFDDCINDHKRLEALFDAILEVNMAICERALRLVGDRVDVVFTADDLGTQGGPQVSPELFRKLFKPRLKRYLTLIHDLSPAKILFHTCGSVWLLLDDLVDAGIDILNPIQVTAAQMDTPKLKERYGNLLSFWGAIDTQQVLPRGSTDDVKAELRRRIDDLGHQGGYVVAAVHNIQPDVPPENTVAMYDFAREYGRYGQEES